MEFSVKKLVASFLVLSAVTGAFSWALGNLSAPSEVPQVRESLRADSGAAFSNEAFDEFTFRSAGGAGSSLVASESSAGNVTEQLAESVIRKVRIKNPSGFSLNDEGQVLGSPATNEDIAEALGEMGLDDIVRQEIPEEKLLILPETDLAKLDSYLRGLATALLTTIGSDEYTDLISASPSLDRLKEIEGYLGEAEEKLVALPVPKDALGIHKKMLAFVGSHRDFFGIVGDYENDPAKTLLVLQNTDRLLEADLDGLRAEVTELIALHYTPERQLSLIEQIQEEVGGLFAVQEAQAFSVTDVLVGALEGTQLGEVITLVATAAETLSTSIGGYTQQLLEWAQRLATEQLKNYLTKLFVSQVLQWTNNDGNQRFVYNWEGFLGDVQEEVTSDAIDEFVPSLCGPYQGYVLQSQGFFGLTGRNASRVRRNCSLTRNGTLLGAFVKDFSQGGWDEYLNTLEPSGNLYGAVLHTSDYVSARTNRARENKINELISNSGFLSQHQCADGSEPGRGDVCEDGSTPRATTPGGLISDSLDRAFAAPLDRIVNAGDLTDLLAALVNSAITGVLSDGASRIAGVVGLGSSGLRDRSSEPIGDVVCSGLSGGALDSCLADAGQAQGAVQQNDLNSEATQQVRDMRSLWADVERATDDSLEIIAQLTESNQPGRFKGYFDLIKVGDREGRPRQIFPAVPGCPYDRLEPPAPYVRDKEERRMEVEELRGQISSLKNVILDLNGEIDHDALERDLANATADSIASLLSTYGEPDEIREKKVLAEERLTALRSLKSEFESNLRAAATETARDNDVSPPVEYQRPTLSACDVPLTTDVFVAGEPIMINP